MAEIQLFMNEGDEINLISFILKMSCTIIPDLNYKSPLSTDIDGVDEYVAVRRKTRLFFVVNKRMFDAPLEMKPLLKDGEKVFYINPLAGGPKMQFLGSGTFEERGQIFIMPGFLAYDPYYWSTKTQEKLKTQPEFLAVYDLIRKHIMKTFTRMSLRKTTIWLAPEAQGAVAQGAKLVGFESFDLSVPQI